MRVFLFDKKFKHYYDYHTMKIINTELNRRYNPGLDALWVVI